VLDFARMQVDARSEYALQLLPALRTVPLTDGLARRAAAQLDDWDGTMAKDRAAPLIFNAWLTRFSEDVLRRAGVPVGSIAVSKLGFVAWLLAQKTDSEAYAADRAAWCGGGCGPILATALAEASADLAHRLGSNPALWRWGAVHDAVFDHPVLRFVPMIGRWVGARVPVTGGTTTINRQEALFGGFDSVHGAAYRGDYDLADLDRSLFMTVPGQSGNVLSATARIFVNRWAIGETITLGPEQPGDIPRARVRLTPAR
jgi:penicillin amidase